MGSKISNTTLWAVIIWVWYADHEDGPEGDVMSTNHSCMNKLMKENSWHYQTSTSVGSGDKLSSKNMDITEIRSLTSTEGPIITSSHRSWRWKESTSSINPQSDIPSEEHLKILFRILSIKITSLIHTRDWSIYAWTSVHTSWVRNTEECRGFRQFAFRIGGARLNPQLGWSILFPSTRDH